MSRYRQPDISDHQPIAPHPNPQYRICEVDGQGWPCATAILGQRRRVDRKHGFRLSESYTSVERALRRATPDGMVDGELLRIEMLIGFERFGSYESWGRGFRVVDERHDVTAERRYLDDAIVEWQARLAAETDDA